MIELRARGHAVLVDEKETRLFIVTELVVCGTQCNKPHLIEVRDSSWTSMHLEIVWQRFV